MATEVDIDDVVAEVLANPIASRIDHGKLNTKIKERSTVDEMQMRGLLYDHPSISPGLIVAHKLLVKRRASLKVESMLQTRPDADELRRKNILLEESETAATKVEHKRKLSRRLSHLLVGRPPMEALADIIFEAGLKANPTWDEETLTTNITFKEQSIDVEYVQNRKEADEEISSLKEENSALREEIDDLKAQIFELEEINVEQRDHMIQLRERSHTHTSDEHRLTTSIIPSGGRRDSLNLEDLQQKVDELTDENFFLKEEKKKALESAERSQAENEKLYEKIQDMTQTITKLMTTRMSFQANDVSSERQGQRKASLAELMNSSELATIAQTQVPGTPGSTTNNMELPAISERTRDAERISELSSVPENLQAMITLEDKFKEMKGKYMESHKKAKELANELQRYREGNGQSDLAHVIDLIWSQPEPLSFFDENETRPNSLAAQCAKTFHVLKRLFDTVSSQKSEIAELGEQLEQEKRNNKWQEEEAAREDIKHKHKASMDQMELAPFSYQSAEAALAALESPEKRKILELQQEIKGLRKSKQALINSTSGEMERMRSRLNTLTFQLANLS